MGSEADHAKASVFPVTVKADKVKLLTCLALLRKLVNHADVTRLDHNSFYIRSDGLQREEVGRPPTI